MRKQTRPILLMLALSLCTSVSFAENQIKTPILGVTYNGLRIKDNPSSQEVGQDLTEISQKFDYVRTYYAKYEGSDKRIVVADEAKSKVKLLLGVYIHDRKDYTDIDYNAYTKIPLQTSSSQSIDDRAIIGALVGNENVAQLGEVKRVIRQIKADAPNIPVSTSQENATWLKADDELVSLVDFIAANIYPFWCWYSNSAGGAPAPGTNCSSSTPIEPDAAFNSFVKQFNELQKKYPNKQIVVTETGYPTNYGKNASLGSDKARSYACQYLQKVSSWARDNKQIVFIYDMFNSQNAVNKKSDFNYNFGIKDKFPLPSFKQNIPRDTDWNCPKVS